MTIHPNKNNILISLERRLLWSTLLRNISVIKVRGEKKYKIAIPEGRVLSGIKTPPMNNKGNFIRFISTIISEVISVGLEETNNPNKEPRNPINAIPMKIIRYENGYAINVGNKRIKIIEIIEVIIIE